MYQHQAEFPVKTFDTTEDSPVSFDHLDGKRQPKGLVRWIFDKFHNVADNDGQHGHQMVAFNYRQAVQNRSMREHRYRLSVKHPCEWYYASEDAMWQNFLTKIKQDAQEWCDYSVKYLAETRWMHRVAGMVENPWHMHPLVFLEAIKNIDMILDEAK